MKAKKFTHTVNEILYYNQFRLRITNQKDWRTNLQSLKKIKNGEKMDGEKMDQAHVS